MWSMRVFHGVLLPHRLHLHRISQQQRCSGELQSTTTTYSRYFQSLDIWFTTRFLRIASNVLLFLYSILFYLCWCLFSGVHTHRNYHDWIITPCGELSNYPAIFKMFESILMWLVCINSISFMLIVFREHIFNDKCIFSWLTCQLYWNRVPDNVLLFSNFAQ